MNDDSSMNNGLLQTTTFESKGDVDADDMETRLGSIEGVRDVEVRGKTIAVTYDPTMIDENAIRAGVENDGVTPLAGGGTAGSAEGTTGLAGDNADLTPFSYSETNPQ